MNDPHALEETLILDSQALAALKASRTSRFYALTVPLLRAAGFLVLILVTGLVAGRHSTQAGWAGYRALVALDVGYVALSWITVLLVSRVDTRRQLGVAWLHVDVVVWCFTIHFLERVSPYAALLLLVRVADQIGFGLRRTLWFMLVATLAYLLYGQIDAALDEPAAIAGAERLPVTAIFLGVGAYFAITAATIEAGRVRQRAAMRAARSLVDELGQAKARAESTSAVKAALLANVSHELRTPLHGILGALDTLATASLTADQDAHLRAARRASLQLLSRVDDLLQVAPQGEGMRVPLRRIPFAPAPCFAALESAFGDRARAKGLAWSVKFDANVPDILVGDPVRFQQALHHLLENAVAYTTSGHVEVVAAFGASGDDAQNLDVRIEDSGPGMTPDQLLTLSSPFERGDSSKARLHGGLGLGLPQARALVGELRGDLQIDSRAGEGTTVVLQLPLTRSAHADAALKPRRARQRIVAVDDDPVNRLVLEGMLLREGFIARVLESGRAALDCIESEGVDLVFMDCHMPEMDGLEATRRIHRLAERQGVPVVGLTADTLPENELGCADAGMTAVLFKPVSSSVLAAAVHLWAN